MLEMRSVVLPSIKEEWTGLDTIHPTILNALTAHAFGFLMKNRNII
jgi:hypothetical protein